MLAVYFLDLSGFRLISHSYEVAIVREERTKEVVAARVVRADLKA